MADALAQLVVDCSVVVKWKIPTEDHATAAEELLVDWEYQAVEVAVPNHFQSEVISAFLRAYRRDRITVDEAREAIRDLLALPPEAGRAALELGAAAQAGVCSGYGYLPIVPSGDAAAHCRDDPGGGEQNDPPPSNLLQPPQRACPFPPRSF
jgi:hypothetical protein